MYTPDTGNHACINNHRIYTLRRQTHPNEPFLTSRLLHMCIGFSPSEIHSPANKMAEQAKALTTKSEKLDLVLRTQKVEEAMLALISL